MAEDRDENGRFVPGHKFWEECSSFGRNPIFENPEDLWGACVEYFNWANDHPLFEDKVFPSLGHESIAKMRAMTIHGLCNYLDINRSTWYEWKESRPHFSDIISRVEDIIYQQKFEGASAGFLNANIIARELGLADKQEFSGKVENTVKGSLGLEVTPGEVYREMLKG